MNVSTPIWRPTPERMANARMRAFMQRLQPASASPLDAYDSLYRFSLSQPAAFWGGLWDYLGLRGEKGGLVVDDPLRLPGARWFPQARLNFAENLLPRDDAADALVFRNEQGMRRALSWRMLQQQVAACAHALESAGVRPGDRVAGYLPNVPEAIVAMLATTSIGAIWCACSPDYGVASCLDRLRQVEPKVLFTTNGYVHGGRFHDLADKSREIAAALPGLARTVTVAYPGSTLPDDENLSYEAFLAGQPCRIAWKRFPFDHPAFILFSSGTTGTPKCIVHGAGGSLLQTLKELALHCDVHPEERVMYLTTTGWMVWNVMASALGLGATVILYDGSPAFPSTSALWDLVDDEDIAVLRIVPRLIEQYQAAGLRPRDSHRLASLKCIQAGSSPLSSRHYEYVYREIKEDVHLMSPAGGTDIMGTLATGSPISPVWAGEIQVLSLGMKVEVYDDSGRPVVGQPGELVCTQAFPSVPVAFWNDDGSRLHAAYFQQIPGAWRHGDWARLTAHGGLIIEGRSDATLNVNGIRIGTSEIYRALQGLELVTEAAAVECPGPDGTSIVLFVVLREGNQLSGTLAADIRNAIRTGATSRHIPASIVQVDDLPRSSNGKVSEVAIRDFLAGRPTRHRDGLLNPEALDRLAASSLTTH